MKYVCPFCYKKILVACEVCGQFERELEICRDAHRAVRQTEIAELRELNKTLARDNETLARANAMTIIENLRFEQERSALLAGVTSLSDEERELTFRKGAHRGFRAGLWKAVKLCEEYAEHHAKDDVGSKGRAWQILQSAIVIKEFMEGLDEEAFPLPKELES